MLNHLVDRECSNGVVLGLKGKWSRPQGQYIIYYMVDNALIVIHQEESENK